MIGIEWIWKPSLEKKKRMKTLAIFTKTSIERGEILTCSELPLFYMNDYSRVGLQVSSCEEALNVLRIHDYTVSESLSCIELAVRKIDEIPAVIRLLSDNGVESQLTDVVTAVYQG